MDLKIHARNKDSTPPVIIPGQYIFREKRLKAPLFHSHATILRIQPHVASVGQKLPKNVLKYAAALVIFEFDWSVDTQGQNGFGGCAVGTRYF